MANRKTRIKKLEQTLTRVDRIPDPPRVAGKSRAEAIADRLNWLAVVRDHPETADETRRQAVDSIVVLSLMLESEND